MSETILSKENSCSSNPLSFDKLMEVFIEQTKSFEDKRTGTNIQYSMTDISLAAFSVFFTQSPSFLSHQTQMKKTKGKSNANSLFKLEKIPTDNHIRDILDAVNPNKILPVFDIIFNKLNDENILEQFNFLDNQLLFLFDATGHFSSNKLHCKKCSTQKHKTGNITYFHNAITPVIAQPGNKNVISLPPEFIIPQDGKTKQDSELAAMARWLEKHAEKYSNIPKTALGDALYANQPNIKRLLSNNFNYILGVKPGSHKFLFEIFEFLENAKSTKKMIDIKFEGQSKRIYNYSFVNNLSLRKENSITVNYAELIITDNNGNIKNKFSCITNHKITLKNIVDILRAYRSRWKIENENNNELKTKGYNLEHNFGHGSENLTSILLTFNLIAFLFHTILGIIDKKYIILRKELGAKRIFFQDIRALTRYQYFESWEKLLVFMLDGLEIEYIDSS